MLTQIEAADRSLLEDISAAMAEAARRSGEWLVCRAGCTQCCLGPFAITALDELRLRRGLAELQANDAVRAQEIRRRAGAYISRIAPEYPGDPLTGTLYDEDALPASMDNEPCPALDRGTGLCELYESRPVTCRTFGPVQHAQDGSYSACELCYEGASAEEIAPCAVEFDPNNREPAILTALEAAGTAGNTIVAFALR